MKGRWTPPAKPRTIRYCGTNRHGLHVWHFTWLAVRPYWLTQAIQDMRGWFAELMDGTIDESTLATPDPLPEDWEIHTPDRPVQLRFAILTPKEDCE